MASRQRPDPSWRSPRGACPPTAEPFLVHLVCGGGRVKVLLGELVYIGWSRKVREWGGRGQSRGRGNEPEDGMRMGRAVDKAVTRQVPDLQWQHTMTTTQWLRHPVYPPPSFVGLDLGSEPIPAYLHVSASGAGQDGKGGLDNTKTLSHVPLDLDTRSVFTCLLKES